MIHYVFHLICYNIAWFGGVLTAAQNQVWTNVIIVTILLIFQVSWQYYRKQTQFMWTFIVLLTVIGFTIDSVLSQLNIIIFKANPWTINICPPWMFAIWINFSMVLYACLQTIFYRYILLGSLALFGFPLAYAAGVKLGAAVFPNGYWSTLLFGIIWAFLLPFTTFCYKKIIREAPSCYRLF